MIPDNHTLFNCYIMPNLSEIESLTRYYTMKGYDYRDNYQSVLIELFKYIHTYDTTRSLKTWLHISVKRYCMFQNKLFYKRILERGELSKIGLTTYNETLNVDVNTFIETLEPIEREIVWYLLQGYKKKKISEMLNISCNSIVLCCKKKIRAKFRVFFASERFSGAKMIHYRQTKEKTHRKAKNKVFS